MLLFRVHLKDEIAERNGKWEYSNRPDRKKDVLELKIFGCISG